MLDNDGNQPVGGGKEHSDNLELSAGLHKIKYLYYDAGNNQINSFQISGPGISKQNIPTSMMLNSGAGASGIHNGDFQLNLFNRGWTTSPSDGSGWTTESKYPFYRAYLSSSSGTSKVSLAQEISVEPGTENKLSFDLGAITGFSNNSTIEVLIDGISFFIKTASEVSSSNGGNTSLTDEDKNMKEYSFSFTPINRTVKLEFIAYGNGKSHNQFFLDNIKVYAEGYCISPSSGTAITNRKLTIRASKN